MTARAIALTRPVCRYHGGKWTLAPWILGFFPAHETYVEPFGGAGSILLRKQPAPIVDVYNDLDGAMVSLFRVLRDPQQSEQLREMIELTPFAREEFERSYDPPSDNPVENARRLLLRASAGFGASAFVRNKTGFRSKDMKAGSHAAKNWARWPEHIPAMFARLRGCVIENQPASQVIARHDAPTTLFYVDPPYVTSTRRGITKTVKHDYAHEMTDADHRALAEQLHAVVGMVVLSGYGSPLYDELYATWTSAERSHIANGGSKRTEVVWLNPACARELEILCAPSLAL